MAVNRGDIKFVLQADGQQVGQEFALIAKKSASLGQEIRSSLVGAVAQLTAGFAGLAGIKALVNMSDQAALTSARLRMVTGSTEAATQAQRDLFAVAQRMQVPFAELQSTFAKIMPAVTELKGGVKEASALTEILVTTAKLSGASAQEASSAATQFAQALGSGVLQGDELKSILENNQTLARELAGALGVGIGQLREMGKQGELTSDKVANALLGRYDQIRGSAAELPQTVSGSLTLVGNSFQQLFVQMNEGGGPLQVLVQGFRQIANVIDIVTAQFRVAGKSSGDFKESAAAAGRVVGRSFAYVIDVVSSVWRAIKTTAEGFGALAAAAGAVLSGNFAGAAEIIKERFAANVNTFNDLKKAISGAGSALQAYDALAANGSSPAEDRRLGLGSSSGNFVNLKSGPVKQDKEKTKDAPKEAEQSMMQAFELALEQRKLAYERENQMREFNKAQELAYWQEMLTRTDLTEKDRAAILLKSARLEVQISRDAAKAQAEITTLKNEDRMKSEHDYITELQAIAQQERDLGLITQQELLARQQQFNAQRMAAELDFLNQKLELAKLDPDKNIVLIEQLELQKQEIYRKYAQSNAQIAREIQAEINAPMNAMIDSLSNGLANAARSVLTDWKNLSKNLRNIFKEIGFSMIDELITKQLKAKLAAWLKEKIFAKAQTFSRLGELSAQAGAGGVASMAAAPFPLNLSAPAFGASMAALAMSFAPVASAAGGFDVPAGLNPITQIHAEEMVLPKDIANPLRESLAGGGGMGGGVNHYHINALDARSFEQFLKDNPAALAAGIKTASRRGFN